MKLICAECDDLMRYKEASGPEDGSMSITFACKKCERKVVLLTNPGETQLLKAMDVKIGGVTFPHRSMDVLRSALAQPHSHDLSAGESTSSDERPFWTNAARKRLDNVPLFIHEMVRVKTEQYAKHRGYRKITPQVVVEAKREFELDSNG